MENVDYEKKLKSLANENEFLQEQLEELNAEMAKFSEGNSNITQHTESEGFFQSTIANLKMELDQVKRNLEEEIEKYTAYQVQNELLELNLTKEKKARQKDKLLIDEIISNQTNMALMEQQVKEIPELYKKINELKSNNAEMRSELEILKMDYGYLKEELVDLKNYKV